jgi:hypothetical protein
MGELLILESAMLHSASGEVKSTHGIFRKPPAQVGRSQRCKVTVDLTIVGVPGLLRRHVGPEPA